MLSETRKWRCQVCLWTQYYTGSNNPGGERSDLSDRIHILQPALPEFPSEIQEFAEDLCGCGRGVEREGKRSLGAN